MIVKTVRAATIKEAVARIKATFGPSALIVETRKVRPRGLLGFLRKPLVEVVVGIEDPATWPGRPPRPLPRPEAPAGPAEDPAVEAELKKVESLERELNAISQSLSKVAETLPPDLPAPFRTLEQRLVEQGIRRERATALVEACMAEQARAGDGRPIYHLRVVLARRFRVAAEPPPAPQSGRPRVLALVGPAGSGKTTLLAKLAGRFALERGEKVALACADFFRVGAVEQLKAYAEVLGVPFHRVGGPEDAPRVLAAAATAAWLLVDTPGLACRDAGKLRTLAAWLKAFEPVERHLVLSATTDPVAALAAIDAYRALGFQRLAVTRVDEAPRLGLLLTAAEAAGVPFSYLGTGQDAAGDLEAAEPVRLARLAMGQPFYEPADEETRNNAKSQIPNPKSPDTEPET